MKELSRQSLGLIHGIIHGENYTNIKARLNQHLPKQYSDAFANIKFFGDTAIWYGDDNISYRPFSSASPEEQEEIACWLEVCKNEVCSILAGEMSYVDKLFTIPSKNDILWYRDHNNEFKITLTQWGFKNKNLGSDVDIIGFLINQPRKITQHEVKVHIDYSDGMPAREIPFTCFSFNNEKQVKTDAEGDYCLGWIFANRTFYVESLDKRHHYDFTIQEGNQYHAVFDYTAEYTIAIEEEFEDSTTTPLPYKKFKVEGNDVETDENGLYSASIILTPNTTIDVQVDEGTHQFHVQRDAESNHFVIKVKCEKPIVPPEPKEKYIVFTLLDFDGSPLANMPFKIIQKNEQPIEATTDQNGKAEINKKLFSNDSNCKIELVVTKEYRENKQKNKP